MAELSTTIYNAGSPGFYNWFRAFSIKLAIPTSVGKQARITNMRFWLGGVYTGYGFNGLGVAIPSGSVGHVLKAAIWNYASTAPSVNMVSSSTNTKTTNSMYNSSNYYRYSASDFTMSTTIDTGKYYLFGAYDVNKYKTSSLAWTQQYSLGWLESARNYYEYWTSAYYKDGHINWERGASIPGPPAIVITYTSAYKAPTINIASPANYSIHDVNATIPIKYDAWSGDGGEGSYVDWSISRGWNRISSGNNSAGTLNFKPSSNSISTGNQFSFTYRRVNRGDTSLTSTNSTRYYRTFSKIGLTASLNYTALNANTELVSSLNQYWKVWSYPSYTEKVDIQFGITDYLSYYKYDTNQRTVKYTLNKSVPFSADGKTIEICYKSVNSVSGVVNSVITKNVKVLFTPIKEITNPSSKIGDITLDDIDKKISWTYPTGQNGIVSEYQLDFEDPNDNTKNFTVKTSITSYTIEPKKLNPMSTYDVVVYPTYVDSSKGINSRGPGLRLPSYVRRISNLVKPVITYPSIDGKWINYPSYRIALTLPVDPDYSYLDTSTKNSYVYNDVEIYVNGTTRSFKNYKKAFSTTSLTYKKPIVINPELLDIATLSPSSKKHTIKIRVNKFGLIWSEWSDLITLDTSITTNIPSTISIGKPILKSHYTWIYNIVSNMVKTYNITPYSNDISEINNSDYTKLRSNLASIISLINNGIYVYDNDKNTIKFKEYELTSLYAGMKITEQLPNNYILAILEMCKNFLN